MPTPPAHDDGQRRWQAEADLLADGRELLEQWCGSPRFRYLYPHGPNTTLLFAAYQEYDRRRAIGRVRGGRWRRKRAFKKLLRAMVRADAIDRTRRLSYRYPLPRLQRLPPPPPVVQQALTHVDADIRGAIAAYVTGAAGPSVLSDLDAEGHGGRSERGLGQFRDGLVNAALARPQEIRRLHPQYLWLLTARMPTRKHHPLASFLLVKLPLQLLLLFVTVFNLAYLGAYYWFNDERLGRFVSERVSGLLEGELQMGSIHWDGSLILDLVTGNPHPVVVEDVTVWEPYKSLGKERMRRAAHADRIEATLVLHEIIPWNRLGIPTLFDIPWVLHFGKVRIEDPIELTVREYDEVDAEGNPVRLIGLRDAFELYEELAPDKKGLSVAVDDAALQQTVLNVDFTQTGEWATRLHFDRTAFILAFEAPDPDFPRPMELPFAFEVMAEGGDGSLTIGDLEVPLADVDVARFASNQADVRAGDVRFEADVLAAGSPFDLRGMLLDVFPRKFDPSPQPPTTIDMVGHSPNVGGLAQHLVAYWELPPQTIVGDHATADVAIHGPLADPIYDLDFDGLSLDLLDEPAWAADDLLLGFSIATQELPEQWAERLDPGARRRVMTIHTLEGAALDGSVGLPRGPDAPDATVVLPEEGEGWLISLPLRVEGVNPGQLFPEDPAMADRLQGAASGEIWVEDLVLAPDPSASPLADPPTDTTGLERLELELDTIEIRRDRGPEDDGLPRRFGLDGSVVLDPTGLDLDDVRLATDGARLQVDGRFEEDLQKIRNLLLDLRVEDGQALARGFHFPPYFDRLEAKMRVFGPTRAPSGTDGTLSVQGLIETADVDGANLWMDRGVLHLRANDVAVFGGRGDVKAELQIFDPGGGISSDPRVYVKLDLRGVDLAGLGAPMEGMADIEVEIGDGEGGRARLSQVRVQGSGQAPELAFAGTTYRDARVAFDLTPEELSIGQLVLPIHRPLSPAHAPGATVEVGRLVADGTFSLDDDPQMDLLVEAEGVPLDTVARLLELEAPVRGQFAQGTRLEVEGRLSRPRVEGKVVLRDLVAANVVLGRGELDVTSGDFDSSGPLAAHREVRVRGSMATAGSVPESEAVRWTVDAVAAIGREPGKTGKPPFSAQLDVSFDRLAIPSLLRDPLAESPPPVDGRLENLSAHVLRCDPEVTMLTDCIGPENADRLSVELDLDHAWIRSASTPLPPGVAPCSDPDTLCSDNALAASIDWPLIDLAHPWKLISGGSGGAELELSGSFDLSAPPESRGSSARAQVCRAPPLSAGTAIGASSMGAPGGEGDAQLEGVIDFEALSGLLAPYGLESAEGRVALDVEVDGYLLAPRIGGNARLAPEEDAFVLETEAVPFPLKFTALQLAIARGWLTAAGQVDLLGGTVEFGTVDDQHTGYALSGPCTGDFELAAQGELSSRLLAELLGDTVDGGKGGVGLPALHVQGSVGDPIDLHRLEGRLAFDDHALGLEFTEGLTSAVLDRGYVDFRRCTRGACPGIAEGWYGLFVGGRQSMDERNPPASAVRMTSGPAGRAWAWGAAYVSPDFQRAEGTSLHLRLDDLPIRTFDGRGRPVVEAVLTSDDLMLGGGAPLVLTGDVAVDRARYVKDAVEGVEILALTEDVQTVESPPPALLQGLQLDLRVQTERPLRVENNVASGVEAELVVEVSGTYEDPEYTGRFDIEPGGEVDIPFLTGTYEIQRGRVTLLRRLEDAEVDVLAMRLEPVYIAGQTRQIQLLLGGTLSAVRWSCLSDGSEAGGELDTVRGCTEYLVLGTGDVQLSEVDVRQYGGGGLANARKPLQVVGHLTELDVGERAAEAAPRLRTYVPDVRLRLGQIGPELDVATPASWWDWDWGRATLGWDYTRGYPGFLLRQSRELKLRLEILDPMSIEYSRRTRDYLNERIIFDPLEQRSLELRFDFQIPSLR